MSECDCLVVGYHVISCDGCGVYQATDEHRTSALDEARRTLRQRLSAQGWRAFVGRSRRVYCPNCGPSRGHTMREESL